MHLSGDIFKGHEPASFGRLMNRATVCCVDGPSRDKSQKWGESKV